MKKRSMLLVLLSALLCLTVLFASCAKDTDDGPGTEDLGGSDNNNDGKNDDDIPSSKAIDYASILDEWNKHLKYTADEDSDDKPLSVTELYEYRDTDVTDMNVDTYENVYVVRTTRTYEYDDYNRYYVDFDIYNRHTAEKIFTDGYNYKVTYDPYDTEETRVGEIRVTIHDAGIFEIRELISEDRYSYSYYDLNGTLVKGDLREGSGSPRLVNGRTNTYLLKIDEVEYLLRDGEIVYVFEDGNARYIPEYDFEYNGYYYTVGNDFVKVYDADFDMVTDYTVSGAFDGDAICTVLSNGNVFVSGAYMLPSDATDYDFEAEGSKIKLVNLVVDHKTGIAKEIETGFLVRNIVTNQDDNGTCISVVNDNNYAEVYKIVDGKLSGDVTFAILNNELGIEAELPVIYENQFSIKKAISDGVYLIEAKGIYYDSYESVYYTADSNNDTVTLSFDPEYHDYKLVDGGFILDDILYSEDLRQIYDLRHVDSYSVYYGKYIIIRDRQSISSYISQLENDQDVLEGKESAPGLESVTTVLYIEGARAITKELSDYEFVDVRVSEDCIEIVENDMLRLYNTHGELLISDSESDVTRYVYEDRYEVRVETGTNRYKLYILK